MVFIYSESKLVNLHSLLHNRYYIHKLLNGVGSLWLCMVNLSLTTCIILHYHSPALVPSGVFRNGAYRNRGACAMIPKEGPVPAGKYWIVDRPEGGSDRRSM